MSRQREPAYYLTPHTHIAVVAGTIIFLDLRSDNYFCVESQYTHELAKLLGIHLTNSSVSEQDGQLGDVTLILDEMIASQILTSDAEHGKRAVLIDRFNEVREMPRADPGAKPRIRTRHIAAFIKAFVVARGFLALVPIENTVGRVAHRKAGRDQHACTEKARELTEIFLRLMPMLISRRDKCLLNSLMLIEFLASFDLYPSWHFGVRLREFAAHCWVQEANLIYNDDVENACEYTVIMIA